FPYQSGAMAVVDLTTNSFTRVDGGLPVNDTERLYIEITPAYPRIPPTVHIDHHRWDYEAHVLQGRRLCLYLDPTTEWDPAAGIEGFLHRLWQWFDDAIANRFDPTTALYHPVGGVFHRTPGTPTVVVTTPLAIRDTPFHVSHITLAPHSDDRIDVVAWQRTTGSQDSVPGLFVVLSSGLPHGGGQYISDLAVAVRGQDSRNQRKKFLAELSKASRRLTPEQHLHVLIAVPNPHLTGETRHQLIGWRLPQPSVDQAVKLAGRRHKPSDPYTDAEPQVEWTYVDDNRTAVTTRRDHRRPVSWFSGKSIELWGCGALGSWIADQLVRAGASMVTLRDSGYVTRGILVRQNYTELDVGRPKVDALADHLRAIADNVTVVPIHGDAHNALAATIDADLVVDCTVNTAVAVQLDHQQRAGHLRCPVMQLATDMLTITTGDTPTTNQLDDRLREEAARQPSLAPFRTFWDSDNHPTLTPTLGCSMPTFHGSSADAMAIAATGVTLAGDALSREIAGGYLFTAPHSPHDVPARTAITLTDADRSNRP
ncbi:MAG TPA: ThiF family adenylyltransferase, partial [Acidimicrobiales bacterium]|nr:ThiF family adenylyltransferase [Acidimicrobiales bacterium]